LATRTTAHNLSTDAKVAKFLRASSRMIPVRVRRLVGTFGIALGRRTRSPWTGRAASPDQASADARRRSSSSPSLRTASWTTAAATEVRSSVSAPAARLRPVTHSRLLRVCRGRRRSPSKIEQLSGLLIGGERSGAAIAQDGTPLAEASRGRQELLSLFRAAGFLR
jgi:hypothetical protein